MKTESGGLFSRFKSNPIMAMLIFLLFGCVLVIGFIISELLAFSDKDQQLRDLVSDLRASSYQLTSLSRDATGGDKQAFGKLSRLLERMDGTWDKFKESDPQTRTALSTEMTAYDGVWSRIRQNSQVITENELAVLGMHGVASFLNDTLPKLQLENKEIVQILLDIEVPTNQVSEAERQIWRAERIGRNVDKMLIGGAGADIAADEFNTDANMFGVVLKAMKEGNKTLGITKLRDEDALEILESITRYFSFVTDSKKGIFDKSPAVSRTRQASIGILDGSPLLLERLSILSEKIDSLPASRKANTTTLLIAGGLALIILIIIGWQMNVATNHRLMVTAEANERNQNAILRLLDELADLADGDLTTTATVTEDFTGAIADSINYTIDQLRVLVSRINETSEEVASAAQDTQQTALHLAEASEHQAQEIAGASAAVNEMAVTIDQVSANAAESAGVAERSVSIASNGAKVVQNTIRGMDTIREQIQETSKRIKRLGESSQEIGDIVSLINDIADQTNILALNAAIQASMAGDAGRGFAVVADEVQRLAERSATATKQIEALVKTIQNDTNEAVISMEQTTSEVVRGARLAQDAGVALEEIETVSANLAELIQNISNAARQQAASAGHISNTMNVIQEITSQTSAGTGATASAIGNLAEMALKLRESVAGFKLPESMSAGDSNIGEALVLESDNAIDLESEEEALALEDDTFILSSDEAINLEDEDDLGDFDQLAEEDLSNLDIDEDDDDILDLSLGDDLDLDENDSKTRV